jgi:cysteine desulfurase/selenocysteine lyase
MKEVIQCRDDFPVLDQQIRGKYFAYLDTAASAQKPKIVIDTEREFYERDYANIHRGVHELSTRASERYEWSREKVRHFINAEFTQEIIYVRGTTEGVNLIAQILSSDFKPGDEIVLTTLEHHSNIVPWQMVAEKTGAVIRVAQLDENCDVDLTHFKSLLNSKTKVAAFTAVSNAIGTVNPIHDMVEWAHAVGALTVVDGAQAVPHMPVDVRALDCDFYVFSAHKMYGPCGIGVVYGKKALLEKLPPYQGGGGMIRSVTFEKTEYGPLPEKYEAGTPNIAGAVGLGKTVEYLENIGMENIAKYEHELVAQAVKALERIPGVHIIGNPKERASVISFLVDDIHPHDLGTLLDYEGVAIRAGHHCAMPLMHALKVSATARASFGLYNNQDDVHALVRAIEIAKRFFNPT